MDLKPGTTEPQESMEAWAKRMGQAPYPGGTLGYLAVFSLAISSWWTALILAPWMAWVELRAKKKSKVKGSNDS